MNGQTDGRPKNISLSPPIVGSGAKDIIRYDHNNKSAELTVSKSMFSVVKRYRLLIGEPGKTQKVVIVELFSKKILLGHGGRVDSNNFIG